MGDNLLELTSSGSKSFGLRYSADESTLIMDRNYSAAWSSVMSWDRVYGNVGIGTVSPAQKLDVSGSYAINGREIFREGSTLLIGDVDAAGGGKEVRIRVSGGDKITIKTNGNVGIGTSFPSFSYGSGLQINRDAGASELSLTGGSGAVKGFVANFGNSDSGMLVGTNGEAPLRLFTNYTERVKITSDGNVGIGTNNPSTKLHIETSGANGLLIERINSTFSSTAQFKNTAGSTYIGQFNTDFRIGTSLDLNSSNLMTIQSSGNVGIGTSNPVNKLHLYENTTNNGSYAGFTIEQDGTGDALLQLLLTDTKRYQIGLDNSDSDKLKFGVGADWVTRTDLTIDGSGNVGIGTTDTFGYKLAVNGTIGAKEVIVETTSAWPDYVFGEEYKLPSLNEVETFTKTNKHLPNVPNQQEIKENGVNVGEMNVILLKKIEELTLYIIEQQKQINSLTEKVNALENE